MADTTWTADDIETLKCAILKKATGQRLTAEDLGGKMQQWADTPLDQLQSLFEEMRTSVANGAAVQRRPMIIRGVFSRGY